MAFRTVFFPWVIFLCALHGFDEVITCSCHDILEILLHHGSRDERDKGPETEISETKSQDTFSFLSCSLR